MHFIALMGIMLIVYIDKICVANADSLENPISVGKYKVGITEYSEDDYFPRLGYAQNVDLRATVRYPAKSNGNNADIADGTFPLFLIQHGNHRVCEVAIPDPRQSHILCPADSRTKNHRGYDNLLQVLASHGIIAVSIDAFDVTGYVPQWINERADLILKHIELFSHLNDPTTFSTYPNFFNGKFNGRVDMSKISISGHSRGGEASVAAFIRNANRFNINSVSSIAPVDGQRHALPPVPYFVILPSADGDVSDLSGTRIYDRAGMFHSNNIQKNGLYIYGANHNFFNSVWASHGDDSWSGRDSELSASDQEMIGNVFLSACSPSASMGSNRLIA